MKSSVNWENQVFEVDNFLNSGQPARFGKSDHFCRREHERCEGSNISFIYGEGFLARFKSNDGRVLLARMFSRDVIFSNHSPSEYYITIGYLNSTRNKVAYIVSCTNATGIQYDRAHNINCPSGPFEYLITIIVKDDNANCNVEFQELLNILRNEQGLPEHDVCKNLVERLEQLENNLGPVELETILNYRTLEIPEQYRGVHLESVGFQIGNRIDDEGVDKVLTKKVVRHVGLLGEACCRGYFHSDLLPKLISYGVNPYHKESSHRTNFFHWLFEAGFSQYFLDILAKRLNCSLDIFYTTVLQSVAAALVPVHPKKLSLSGVQREIANHIDDSQEGYILLHRIFFLSSVKASALQSTLRLLLSWTDKLSLINQHVESFDYIAATMDHEVNLHRLIDESEELSIEAKETLLNQLIEGNVKMFEKRIRYMVLVGNDKKNRHNGMDCCKYCGKSKKPSQCKKVVSINTDANWQQFSDVKYNRDEDYFSIDFVRFKNIDTPTKLWELLHQFVDNGWLPRGYSLPGMQT